MILTKRLNLFIIVGCLTLLNIAIYFRAFATIEPIKMAFAECARNSGRTSALLNLLLIFMLGHYGFKAIYKKTELKNAFYNLAALLAVNHLIHFIFLYNSIQTLQQNFNPANNKRGIFLFVCITIYPVVYNFIKKLNPIFYVLTLLHFINLTYFMCETFYSRYKPVDPAYLHRLGVLVMIATLIYILYRVYKEKSIGFD